MNQSLDYSVSENSKEVKFTTKELKNFWRKVNKTESCWIWKGSKTSGGYGKIRQRKTTKSAHRVSWEIHFGKIPKGVGIHGISVCHKCDIRDCVNPLHLFIGTHTDNMRDAFKKGRIIRPQGSENHNAVLNEEKVVEIRNLFAKGFKKTQIGMFFQCGETTIAHVINRDTWKHVI